ncbi:T9SS C-terminal target domain-containing protein, partial [Pseudoxanthomonas sp. SGD-10]
FRSADGTANTNTSKYLIKAAESQRVEIFVNSTSNDISYSYGNPAASVSLIANTYHVYVNGVRYDEEFPKVGTSYSESAINAFAINTATSTSAEYVGVSNLSIVYQTETNLPVSLTSFNAAKTQSGVQLKWQTASEQNNQYFDVLWSSDGKEFISIARVEGAGTSSVSKNYTFVDNSPLAGYNYYKLIQVDADGKATDYEDFVQVVNYGLDNNQNVFVFVAEQLLTVKAESESDANGSIEVYNTAGKLVLSQQVNVVKGNNQFNLDLGTLASGVYIVKADLGSKAEIVKVVK